LLTLIASVILIAAVREVLMFARWIASVRVRRR
jgi:hypothetical protein